MLTLQNGVVLIATSAACALLSWRGASRLVAARDSPLIAEKVQQFRGWMTVLGIFAVLLQPLLGIVAGAPHDLADSPFSLLFGGLLLAPWPITLAILVGYYPARRSVFGDRSSLAGYLGHTLRIAIAFAGPWVLLTLAPYLTYFAASFDLAAGILLLAVLLLWWRNFGSVTLGLLDGRPLDDPALARQCREIVDRSKVAGMESRSIGPTEGSWANASALPTARPPLVVLSRPLLRAFESSHSAAIFAREVARVERFPHRAIGLLLPIGIAVATLAEPLLARASADAAQVFRWLWLPVLAILARRLSMSLFAHESEIDLRAWRLLGGDRDAAEDIANALDRLYEANRLPKGPGLLLSGDANTPTSLAARQQALRSATADSAEGRPAEPTPLPRRCLRGRDGDLLIVDAEGFRHLTGLPPGVVGSDQEMATADVDKLCAAARSVQRVGFEELLQALIQLSRKGPEILLVRRNMLTTRFPIDAEKVEIARRILEDASERIAAAGGGTLGSLFKGSLAAFFSAVAAFPLSFSGYVSMGVTLLLLVFGLGYLLLRRRTWLAATGAMALALGLGPLLAGTDPGSIAPVDWLCLAVMVVGGGVCLFTARNSGPTGEDPRGALPTGSVRVTVSALLVASLPLVIGLASAVSDDVPLLRLNAIARESHGVFATLFAAGTVLALFGRRRLATIGLLLLGVLPAALATDTFLARVADDPLAAEAATLQPQDDSRASVIANLTVDEEIWSIRLAPAGGHVVLRVADESEAHHEHAAEEEGENHPHEASFLVAATDGPERATLRAVDVAFADDEQLLVLVLADAGPELRLLSVTDPTRVVWRLALTDTSLGDEAALDVFSDQWRLSARGETSSVLHAGQTGGNAFRTRRWKLEPTEESWLVMSDTRRALELNWGVSRRGTPMSLERFAWVAGPKYWLTRLQWRNEGDDTPPKVDAVSALATDCRSPSGAGKRILCLAHGRQRMWIWLFDPATAEGRPLAETTAASSFAWTWTGRHLVMLRGKHLLVVDADTDAARRVPLPRESDWSSHLALSGHRAAVTWPGDRTGGTHIALLDLANP